LLSPPSRRKLMPTRPRIWKGGKCTSHPPDISVDFRDGPLLRSGSRYRQKIDRCKRKQEDCRAVSDICKRHNLDLFCLVASEPEAIWLGVYATAQPM
jgi:hypothetical protein